MNEIFELFIVLLTGYYILYSLIILGIYFLASVRVWFTYKQSPFIDIIYNKNPSVSVVLPAFNEEVSICHSVKSVLNQTYGNIDIIIVDDGSTDNTSLKLIKEFDLKKSNSLKFSLVEKIKNTNLYTSDIIDVYENKKNKITLVRSKNGGKSSALNVGIILSNSYFVLNVDSDTILVKDAIEKTLRYMRSDTDAVSCLIGIINGNEIHDGEIIKHEIPTKLLPKIQWLEYIRSFILWRTANDKQNATLVMPGAYSFIKREIVLDIGGYKKNYLSEDMELTMNIVKNKGKIQFISEFFAWTEVPENLTSLTKQRIRWYRGSLQNLIKYWKFLFNKNENRYVSFYMIPFLWFADVIGIWVELIGLITMGILFLLDVPIDWDLFILSWIVMAVLYYSSMIIIVLFTKYKIMKKNEDFKLYRIIPVILLEIFTYHFLNLFWMIKSHTNEYIGTDKKWNKFKRKGFLVK
jgi:cellulose synthase/poly-beta-1,6-N-acetylglucosamine synthase-like glycosyltransferase